MYIGKFSSGLESFNWYRDRCIVVGCNSETKKDLRLRFNNFLKANDQIVGVENDFVNLEKVD